MTPYCNPLPLTFCENYNKCSKQYNVAILIVFCLYYRKFCFIIFSYFTFSYPNAIINVFCCRYWFSNTPFQLTLAKIVLPIFWFILTFCLRKTNWQWKLSRKWIQNLSVMLKEKRKCFFDDQALNLIFFFSYSCYWVKWAKISKSLYLIQYTFFYLHNGFDHAQSGISWRSKHMLITLFSLESSCFLFFFRLKS